MGDAARDGQISTLQVDESFATQDDRFVDQVRKVTAPKYLAGLADRWKIDPRPWARRQIFEYLALPLDRPEHHPLVKRLFKQAEAKRDHQLMGVFLVAFDRLVRRLRRTRYRYDYQSRQSWREEELFLPRDQILGAGSARKAINPRTGEKILIPSQQRIPKNGRLFSYRTRNYLRRRANRYFRRLGFQQPGEYVSAVSAALERYRDEDFAAGENILDNWSLMHIAFRRSAVLQFTRIRVEVIAGGSLGGLLAAPQFEPLWQTPDASGLLLHLTANAQSRLVRVWSMQLLKRLHAVTLQTISAEQLLALLDHADEEVQQFGASLLEKNAGIDSWPIATWLKLLQTRSVTVLATICQAMSERVNPARLNLEQCLDLAIARATPVARMGLVWLSSRPINNAADRTALGRLADAECEAVGVEAAQFALSHLGAQPTYRLEDVSPFFDSLNAQVRRGAWDWLKPGSAGYDDAALWSRLLETPYDDVRLQLVAELNQRTRKAGVPRALERQDITQVWTTVLLGVHRGGRAKLTALRQISQAMADQPERAERLLPVLVVAIRSVRPPEARAGLSAILSAVAARPELEQVLAKHLPELRLVPVEAEP
jgi:hypothetical protein